jgi:exosome complex RNA-binding protein Csl4
VSGGCHNSRHVQFNAHVVDTLKMQGKGKKRCLKKAEEIMVQTTEDKMAQIKVKCGSCGREFYMEDWEIKSCPNCGKVTKGPKAK